MTRRTAILLLILFAAGPVGATAAGELVVVAHPEVPLDSINVRELQRIYLGKSTRWSGGERIRPVMLETDQPARALFVTELLDRTEENFSVYWKRMIFTGKGRPPRAFATPEELAFYVRTNPGAIGFLSADSDATGLKVIHVH